ncbi:MAG: AAA family ATPase [Phycisphaerae bacterium]|jgi:predicted ATPase
MLDPIPEAAANDPVSYEKQVLSAFPVACYHQLLVNRRDSVAQQESISLGEDWAFVAITDHNVCSYATALSMYAWEQRDKSRLVVFPGLELDVSFPVGKDGRTKAHVILIYPPGSEPSDIRVAVHGLTTNNWEFGHTAEVSSLPAFINGLRNHKDYQAIAIAAHVASGKGVRGAAKALREGDTFTALDAAIARTSAELEHNQDADKDALNLRLEQLKKDRQKESEQVSFDILDLVGACGFDGLQVSCKQDESHYRRLHRFQTSFGRAVPLVASDAHRAGDIFACENNFPYLKLPVELTKASNDKILTLVRRAIRYGETRFSYSTPGQVTRWISGLEITPDVKTASAFWPFDTDSNGNKSFVLPLSRNLNCLVGGRGSGKSAAIEAIAFVTDPAKFQGKQRKHDDDLRKHDDDLEDWYRRAKATLAGCHVRLVWQVAGSTDGLPKGAIFSSRYFNPSGEHGAVSHANTDDKEILSSAFAIEPPKIFRARQIENAAAPAELRQLFDTLVGERIPTLEKEIADLQAQLAQQREDMDAIALRISGLTQEDAPLREYYRRKIAYEAANSPEVQPFYKHLDEADAAEGLARDAKVRWDQAVTDTEIGKIKSKLLAALDAVSKKLVDKTGKVKPHCDGMARLFVKDKNGVSPRDRLQGAIEHAEEEVAAVEALIKTAVTETGAEHKNAREVLVKKGLPPGAKDREAKKQDFKTAEENLDEYREMMQEWLDRVQLRNQKFHALVETCKERTKLRTETAGRLCAQLGQDLDPSVLVIKVEVHPMEDRTSFREWLSDHIAPSISRSKEGRVAALIDNGILPNQMRDSLLGEIEDAAAVFTVDKDKASDGRIEPELATKIVQECSGKVRLEAEHTTAKEKPSPEFVKKLPPEIRDGLWTFPLTGPDSDDLIVDGVLALDEVVFDDRPEILLNDRPRETGSTLRPIDELSPGQRCSAILPILLLNGRSPLIIDQPEDNLDNRLIRQVIVNILASIKLRRQVIVATHNPNLPVLGDVEQAVVLRAVEEKQACLESMGNLDSPDTVAHLTEIMEGGREAFQYRQSIYQSHWAGPIAAV